MKNGELDDLDKYIIYALQQDARNTSSGDIASEMGVSSSTVRNRIHQLEDEGIINGYYLDIDYEAAGFQLYTKIVCSAPISKREELARKALDVTGVAAVREIMTGGENVYINAVGTDHDDLSRIAQELNELGLEVSDEKLVRNEYVSPFRGFATNGLEK